MGFLRRILGGGPGGSSGDDDGSVGQVHRAAEGGARPTDAGSGPEEEAARDRELLREEAARLDDDLLQRQLRYADRSWTPPRQGGPKRAGEDAGEDED